MVADRLAPYRRWLAVAVLAVALGIGLALATRSTPTSIDERGLAPPDEVAARSQPDAALARSGELARSGDAGLAHLDELARSGDASLARPGDPDAAPAGDARIAPLNDARIAVAHDDVVASRPRDAGVAPRSVGVPRDARPTDALPPDARPTEILPPRDAGVRVATAPTAPREVTATPFVPGELEGAYAGSATIVIRVTAPEPTPPVNTVGIMTVHVHELADNELRLVLLTDGQQCELRARRVGSRASIARQRCARGDTVAYLAGALQLVRTPRGIRLTLDAELRATGTQRGQPFAVEATYRFTATQR